MAKKTRHHNGSSRLDEEMAALAHSMVLVNQTTAELNQSTAALNRNHVAFLERIAATDKAMADLKREADEKYAAILRVLAEHSRILERLPDAIREKIGFKTHSTESFRSTFSHSSDKLTASGALAKSGKFNGHASALASVVSLSG